MSGSSPVTSTCTEWPSAAIAAAVPPATDGYFASFAFRVRNVEAGILLAAAMVVMLGVNPYGVMLFSWVPSMGPIPGGSEFLPWVTNWLMEIPNAAAQRGIIIGAALGAAAMSLRVLLGIERSYLGIGSGGGS